MDDFYFTVESNGKILIKSVSESNPYIFLGIFGLQILEIADGQEIKFYKNDQYVGFLKNFEDYFAVVNVDENGKEVIVYKDIDD